MALTIGINPIYLTLPAGELNLSNLIFFNKDGAHNRHQPHLPDPAGRSAKPEEFDYFQQRWRSPCTVYQPHLLTLPAGKLKLRNLTFLTKDGSCKPFLKGHLRKILWWALFRLFSVVAICLFRNCIVFDFITVKREILCMPWNVSSLQKKQRLNSN